MILRMILDIHTAPEGKKRKINFTDLQIHPLRYGLFKLYYDRARLFRLMRERVSALYTHAYGLFRYYYFFALPWFAIAAIASFTFSGSPK